LGVGISDRAFRFPIQPTCTFSPAFAKIKEFTWLLDRLGLTVSRSERSTRVLARPVAMHRPDLSNSSAGSAAGGAVATVAARTGPEF